MSDVASQPQRMPPFRLPASTGQTLRSDAWVGKMPMVIFFLTDLDDELDRNEILEYNTLLGDFGAERSQALGVVKATARRVRDVSEELRLSIPILADAGGEMIEDFGVAEPDGRARRVTFLVDRNGTIIRRIDSSSTEDQAATMLNAVKALKSGEIEAAEGAESAEPPG